MRREAQLHFNLLICKEENIVESLSTDFQSAFFIYTHPYTFIHMTACTVGSYLTLQPPQEVQLYHLLQTPEQAADALRNHDCEIH